MLIDEYPLKVKNWFDQITFKRNIIIHGSGSRTSLSPMTGKKGTARDVVDKWNMLNDKNACPFVIDRNGSIIQTYPENEWAYHLRIFGTQGSYDKQSIGIELVNELGLIKQGKDYYINSYPTHTNLYKGPVFEREFRNFKYWADLDPLQLDALIDLTKYLCKKHLIDPVFFTKPEIFDKKIWDKATIFTHSNVNSNTQDMPLNDWVIEKLAKTFPVKNKKENKQYEKAKI